MATKFESVSGSYDKTVEDSGKDQSKAKFSNPINKPTDDLPKPHQTINKPTDSKDSSAG